MNISSTTITKTKYHLTTICTNNSSSIDMWNLHVRPTALCHRINQISVANLKCAFQINNAAGFGVGKLE